MGKFTISYDTYDAFLEICDRMESPTYWPDLDDIEIMRENPDKWISFACYLWEKGQKPQNKEEQYKKKNLFLFIQDTLELCDDGDPIQERSFCS